MGYTGPRRKSKLQKACEALDPGCRLEGPIRVGYSAQYVVKDSAGKEIGWTDGNEGMARFAWMRALDTLRARA
jgi:hypothetical protein